MIFLRWITTNYTTRNIPLYGDKMDKINIPICKGFDKSYINYKEIDFAHKLRRVNKILQYIKWLE